MLREGPGRWFTPDEAREEHERSKKLKEQGFLQVSLRSAAAERRDAAAVDGRAERKRPHRPGRVRWIYAGAGHGVRRMCIGWKGWGGEVVRVGQQVRSRATGRAGH